MQDGNYAFVPNKEMIDNLQISILSSPIVFVPHYDVLYLKRTLKHMVQNHILDIKDNLYVEENQICFCNTYAFSENKKNTANDIEYVRNLFDNPFSSSIRFEDGTYDAFLKIKDISNTNEDEQTAFDKSCIFIFENIIDELNSPKVQYALLKFAQCYEEGKLPQLTTIIIIDNKPSSMLPREIQKFVRVVEIPYPTINERKIMVEYWLNKISSTNQSYAEKIKDELGHALGGLTFFEVNSILRTISYAKTNHYLNRSCIRYAFEEKKKIVQKSGLLDVEEPDVKFKDVGGLYGLKYDIEQTKTTYFDDIYASRRAALSYPKGILIIGMPGCGKTMIAKAIAEHFHIPLLKMDISKIQGKYYGESEENLKKALKIAEMSSPCVLWIDEVEKAFSGAEGRGHSDPLMIRVMGQFLTWQQEHNEPVYVVATANDAMRDEFMRKGRFDEVYFVNFPDRDEVESIFLSKLEKYREKTEFYNFSKCPSKFDENTNDETRVAFEKLISSMCSESVKFTGAEIEYAIKRTMELLYNKYVECKKNSPVDMCDDENLRSIVEYKDFQEQVNNMAPYVMFKSCRKARKADSTNKEHDNKYSETAIDRIFDLFDQYKFKDASKIKKI